MVDDDQFQFVLTGEIVPVELWDGAGGEPQVSAGNCAVVQGTSGHVVQTCEDTLPFVCEELLS